MDASTDPGNKGTVASNDQDRIAQLESELAQARAANKPADDDKERPWRIAQENVKDENTRDEAPLPYRGPGAVLHRFPILTGGSGGNLNGPWVRALAELLAQAGYATNDVIKGLTTHFDNSLKADVDRFRADHDVKEPLDAYQGHSRPASEVVANLVGPYTIQALLELVADKVDQPVEQLVARVEYDVQRALAA